MLSIFSNTVIYIRHSENKMYDCGKNPYHDLPIWKLGDQHNDIEDQLEILGTTFSSSMSYHSLVEKRCQASRRAMCGRASIPTFGNRCLSAIGGEKQRSRLAGWVQLSAEAAPGPRGVPSSPPGRWEYRWCGKLAWLLNSCIVTTFYFFHFKSIFNPICVLIMSSYFFLMKLNSLEVKPIAIDVGIKVGIKARRW